MSPPGKPTSEAGILRAVRTAAPVLLLMCHLNRPAGETELARVLDFTPSTVRTHLRQLERCGLVTRIYYHNGWVLSPAGRRFLGLPPGGEVQPLAPEAFTGSRTAAEPEAIDSGRQARREKSRGSVNACSTQQDAFGFKSTLYIDSEPPVFTISLAADDIDEPAGFTLKPGNFTPQPAKPAPESGSFTYQPVNTTLQPANLGLVRESELKKSQSFKEEEGVLTLLKREEESSSSDSDSLFNSGRSENWDSSWSSKGQKWDSRWNSKSQKWDSRCDAEPQKWDSRCDTDHQKWDSNRFSNGQKWDSNTQRESGSLRITELLDAAEELFGEPILLDSCDEHQLLAWIAEVYDRRDRCKYPARVVYTSLKRGEQPLPQYLRDPCAYLPEGFLVAAGLREPAGEGPYGDENWEDEPEAPPEPEPAESCFQPLDASGMTPYQAWEMVQDELRWQMIRWKGHYEKYIQPARLVHFADGPGIFTIAVPDKFACEWLSDRLTALAERRLHVLCSRPVRVVFRTWEDLTGAKGR